MLAEKLVVSLCRENPHELVARVPLGIEVWAFMYCVDAPLMRHCEGWADRLAGPGEPIGRGPVRDFRLGSVPSVSAVLWHLRFDVLRSIGQRRC